MKRVSKRKNVKDRVKGGEVKGYGGGGLPTWGNHQMNWSHYRPKALMGHHKMHVDYNITIM